MKNFIIVLVTFAALVSCGKDNSVGSGVPNIIAVSPIQTINSDANFQTLSRSIANNSFIDHSNYYTTYKYGILVNTCVTKDGWFGIDYQKCSSSATNPTSVLHGTVNIESKKAELNAILAKTVVFKAVTSTFFILRTSDNLTYQIRTDYPIQANPLYSLNNATGKATSLLSVDMNGQ